MVMCGKTTKYANQRLCPKPLGWGPVSHTQQLLGFSWHHWEVVLGATAADVAVTVTLHGPSSQGGAPGRGKEAGAASILEPEEWAFPSLFPRDPSPPILTLQHNPPSRRLYFFSLQNLTGRIKSLLHLPRASLLTTVLSQTLFSSEKDPTALLVHAKPSIYRKIN